MTKDDICRHMGISLNTLQGWMKDPGIIQMKNYVRLAGLFGISPEELLYIVLRNKPQLNQEGSWYLEAIKKKHEGK